MTPRHALLRFLVTIVLMPVFAYLQSSNKGRRIVSYSLAGGMILVGLVGLITGRLSQYGRTSGFMEGPAATVGSSVILALGLWILYVVATRKAESGDDDCA